MGESLELKQAEIVESEALPMVWQRRCRTQKQEISMPVVSRQVLPAHEDDSADLEAPF